MSSSGKELLRQIPKYAMGIGGPALVAALSTAIFTRLFEAQAYGAFMVAWAGVNIAASFFGQWLQQPIGRYLAGASPEEEQRLLASLWPGLGILLAVVIMLGSGGAFIISEYKAAYSNIWLPATVLVALQVVVAVGTVVLQARMQANIFASQQILLSLGRFFFPLFFFYFFTHESQALLWGYVIAALCVIPFSLNRSGLWATLYGGSWGIRERLSGLKEMASYGLPMTAWFVATNILSMSDRLIIGYFRGEVEAGIYSANYSLMNGTVGLVTAPILSATWPFLMRAWGSGDKQEAERWLGNIATAVLGCGIGLFSFVAVLAQDLANLLLGPGFRSGAFVMPIVVGGMVAFSVATYAHKPFEFHGKTKSMVLMALLAGGLNVLLNMLFVPVWGYGAAAIATLMSYIFYTLLAIFFGRRLLSWRWNLKLIVVAISSSVIGGAAALGFVDFFGLIDPVARLCMKTLLFLLLGGGGVVAIYRSEISEFRIRRRAER